METVFKFLRMMLRNDAEIQMKTMEFGVYKEQLIEPLKNLLETFKSDDYAQLQNDIMQIIGTIYADMDGDRENLFTPKIRADLESLFEEIVACKYDNNKNTSIF